MGELVCMILQLRFLRVQLAVSVLIVVLLAVREIYARCGGRNPMVFGALWMLPLAGLFVGKWTFFERKLAGIEALTWELLGQAKVAQMFYWCVAALLLLGFVLGKWRALRRVRAYRTVEILPGFCRVAGGQIVVKESDREHSPYTIGTRRPYIVLPKDYESQYSREELQMVLLHEGTHIRCRHTLFFALVYVLRCLFWCNPLIYYGIQVFRTDMEIICDARVAQQTERKQYGRLILQSAAGAGEPEGLVQRVNFFFSQKEIRTRILVLTGYRKSFLRSGRRVLAVTGMSLVVAAVLVLAGSQWSVAESRGVDSVVVVSGEDVGRRIYLELNGGQEERIISRETNRGIVVDTLALRELLKEKRILRGCVMLQYGSYRFGPAGSDEYRESVECNLYDPGERYVVLPKSVSGWRSIIRYL